MGNGAARGLFGLRAAPAFLGYGWSMTQQASLLASRVGAGRAEGGRRHRSVDPAHTGQVVAEVLLAEPATFVDACRAARDAQPAWAATPAPVRGRVVKHLGRLVEENAEALARLVTREIGKPLAESRGEVTDKTVGLSNALTSGNARTGHRLGRCRSGSRTGCARPR